MSLADVLDQAINKSVTADAPKPAKPEPEKVEAQSEESEEELEDSEESGNSVVDEVEEELDDQEAKALGEDDEEEALSSKFKEEALKKDEVKTAPRMEKIIEDGIERDISVDELKKGYQKASVSGKRFEEASQMKKEAFALKSEVQDFVEMFDYNPIAAGYEVIGQERMDAFLEQYRKDMNAFDQMSDVEKENFILRRNQSLRDIKAQFKNGQQTEELSEAEAQAIKENLTQKVEKVILDSGFRTNEMKIRLLNKMKAYSKQKPPGSHLELSEIEMLADRVKDETKSELSDAVAGMSGDELIEYLGAEVVDKVRRKLVEKFKIKKAQKVQPTKKIESKKPGNQPKSKTDYEAFWKNPS